MLLEYTDLFHVYSSRCADKLKIGAQRQLKGQMMFKEGHVHSLFFHGNPLDGSAYGFIKAKVLPSLPSKDAKQTPDYSLWVCLSTVTGHILSASCNCTAG
jgi:hypothetical protein